MKASWSVALLFCSVLLPGFHGETTAQQDPGSLLGTIINEAVRQSRPPSEYNDSPYDSQDDYYNDRYYDMKSGKRLTCESQGGRYNYCRTDTRGRIRLDRQLSDTPCRQYDTWGSDGDGSGVWVSGGCRASFLVEPRRPGSGRGNAGRGGRGGKTITCESKGGQYSYCRTDTHGRVSLERQLSNTPCREYDTWGSDGDGSGIWVSEGCRGVFVVESGRGGRYGDERASRDTTLVCRSDKGRYNYCSTRSSGRVRLVRRLSDAPCREYDTWGSDDDGGGIWVDRGCSAEFSID